MTHPRKEETARSVAEKILKMFHHDHLVFEEDLKVIQPLLESYAEQKVKENEEESAKYHDQHLMDATVLIRNEALEEAAKLFEGTKSVGYKQGGWPLIIRYEDVVKKIRALKSPERAV